MASSATISCGGNCDLLGRRFCTARIPATYGVRSCSLRPKTAISATLSLTRKESAPIERRDRRSGEAVAPENLDQWMRETVGDIVRNLRDGPLMAHVYRRSKRDDGASVALEIERAAEENVWKAAKERWEAGDAPVPEGLIFVEELADRRDVDGDVDGDEGNDGENVGNDGATRAWGVVVQGRGAECPPACYLLKTTTAGLESGSGCGLGCTHFCLVRVNGLWETTESQLRNCWLLQAQAQFRAQAP